MLPMLSLRMGENKADKSKKAKKRKYENKLDEPASLPEDTTNSKAQSEVLESDKIKKKKHKKNKFSLGNNSCESELNLECFPGSFQENGLSSDSRNKQEEKCGSTPEVNNVSDICDKDIGIGNQFNKLKKEKKSKKKAKSREHGSGSEQENDKNKNSVLQASSADEFNETSKTKTSKKKRMSQENERDSDGSNGEKKADVSCSSTVGGFTTSNKTKKHKKKRKSQGEEPERGSDLRSDEDKNTVACTNTISDFSNSDKSKKHKKKRKSEGEENEMGSDLKSGEDKDNVSCSSTVDGISTSNRAKKHKKKKKSQKQVDSDENDQGKDSAPLSKTSDEFSTSDQTKQHKVKKKGKSQEEPEGDSNLGCHENRASVTCAKTENGSFKSNKTKKKSQERHMNSVENKDSVCTSAMSKSERSFKNSDLDDNGVKPEKKKKKVREIEHEVSCEANVVSLPLSDKKSKKKHIKENGHFPVETERNSLNDKCSTNKKKTTYDNELGPDEGKITLSTSIGCKKKKRKQNGDGTDVTGCSGEQQNDEKITLKRQRTLDDETTVSEDSPKSVALLSQKTPGQVTQPIAGQWQGDLFDNAERQNKFLRLLGGMRKDSSESTAPKTNKLFKTTIGAPKKGLFGSLASRVGGGSALTVSDAAHLNQKLEEDYNKALNLKLGGKKGTGFGFVPDPAEGKTFHIDINKTKSTKFDD